MGKLNDLAKTLKCYRSSLNLNVLNEYEDCISNSNTTGSIIEVGAIDIGLISALAMLLKKPKSQAVVFARKGISLQSSEHCEINDAADFNAKIPLVAKSSGLSLVIDSSRDDAESQLRRTLEVLPFVLPGGLIIIEGTSERSDRSTGPSIIDIVARVMAWRSDARLYKGISSELIYLSHIIDKVSLMPNALSIKVKNDTAQYSVSSLYGSNRKNLAACLAYNKSYARNALEKVDGLSERHHNNLMILASTKSLPPPVSIYELENCTIIGPGILRVQESIIDESLNCIRNLKYFYGLCKSAQAVFVPSQVESVRHRFQDPSVDYIILKQAWDKTYGHWLIDVLPRMEIFLDLAERSIIQTREKRVIIVNKMRRPMQIVVEQSLGMMGILSSEITALDYAACGFDRLYYPAPLTTPPASKSPYILRMAKRIKSSCISKRHFHEIKEVSKIYVSRNSGKRRTIFNEAELVSLLQARGFRVVYPERLSFAEQVSTFDCASHIVGNLGSALCNLIFSRPGVKVLGIAAPVMGHDDFFDLVSLVDGRYWGYNGYYESAASPGMDDDFFVDVSRISVLLDDLLGCA